MLMDSNYEKSLYAEQENSIKNCLYKRKAAKDERGSKDVAGPETAMSG